MGRNLAVRNRRPSTIEPVIKPGSRKAIAGLRFFAGQFAERPDLLVRFAAMIVRNAKP